jgi:glycosyltransferase involved in cell wall biosynthesis
MPSDPTPCRGTVGFVVTCKGRLHHVQRTLPLIVAQAPDEIVLVDYGCPQRAGDWVEANLPSVKVVRVNDDPGFCHSRARNLGAQRITSPWICFADADILAAPGWVDWMRRNLAPGFYYRRARVDGDFDKEAFGTMLCARSDHVLVHGYDEMFRGWGGEDEDFYDRLNLAGVKEAVYPAHLVEAIPHDDAERVQFQSIRNKEVNQMVSIYYRAAKMQLMTFTNVRTELPLATRQHVDRAIREAFGKWGGNQALPLPEVTFEVSCSAWLPPPYKLQKRCRLTLGAADTRVGLATASAPTI